MLDDDDLRELVDLLRQAIEKGSDFGKVLVNLPVVPISRRISEMGKSGRKVR